MMDALVGFAHWLETGQGWLPVLLDAVIKATLVLGLAAVAAQALRRASAASRHAVWTAAIVGSLALPPLLVSLPQWRLSVLPASQALVSPALDPGTAVGQRVPADPGFAGAGSREDGHSIARVPRPEGAPTPAPRGASLGGLTTSGVLMAIWAGVAVALLSRLAFGHSGARRLARTKRDGVRWLQSAREIAAEAGVTPPPAFVEGPPDSMPMTWGILRPVVMLPSNHAAWPAARRRMVLLHELAHVARRDCLTQLLANIGCALYWFNPLSWLAASRLASERERACDEWVVAAGTDGPEYAEQLLDIARTARPAGLSWSGVSMARRSQLEGRLLAILDPERSQRPFVGVAAFACVAAIAVAVPIVAAVRPASAPAALDASPATAGQVQTPLAPVPMPTPVPSPTPSPSPRVAAAGAIGGFAQAVAGGVADGVKGGFEGGARGGVEGGVRGTHERSDDEAERAPADPKVVDALIQALKDSDADVREQALFALGRRADASAAAAVVPMLTDVSPEIREQAAVVLGQMRSASAVEPLLAALRDGSAGVREKAAFAVAQLKDVRAVEPLIALLADDNAPVREQACFALAQLRDKRATPKLVSALEDTDKDVRGMAAFALAQLRDPAAAPALAAKVRDADADVREQVVFALSQLRDPQAVEPLIQALEDQATDVQAHAAFALGQIHDRRAVPPLIRALQSGAVDVRASAAFALGQLRDPAATTALTAAIRDADAEVRRAAAFALSQLSER